MNYIKLLIALLVLSNISNAQVNLFINYDDIKNNPPELGFPCDRYYYGDFNIEGRPAPLVSTEVNFTLVAIRPDGRSKSVSEDWILKIVHNNNATRILGDTILIWPGPHDSGVSFTGSFQFVPLISGNWDVAISRIINSDDPVNSISDYISPIAFSYCLDEDGQVCYLDRSDKTHSRCTQMNVIFFDSSIVKTDYYINRPRDIFNYNLKISPLPKIGDTSNLDIQLIAIKGLPNGCDLLIDGYYMEYLSQPKPIHRTVNIGDKIDLNIRFVPARVRDGHKIVIKLSDLSMSNLRDGLQQVTPLKFIFDNDGNLRYLSHSGFPGMTEDKLPDAFPPKESSQNLPKKIRLKRE